MNDLEPALPDELHLQEATENQKQEAKPLSDEVPAEKQEDTEPPKDEATDTTEQPEPDPNAEGEGEEDGEDEDDPKLSKTQQRRLRQKNYQERLRTENADLQRRLADLEKKVANPPQQEDAEPKLEDFDDYEQYIEAKVEHRVKQEVSKGLTATKEEAERAALVQSNEQREAALMNKGRDAHEDFDAVFSGVESYLTPAIASTVLASEHGHELLYALGQDTAKAVQIASLPPAAAALELGKMEAFLTQPVPKKTTQAPQPFKTPSTSNEAVQKDPSDMTQKEYEAWRSKS